MSCPLVALSAGILEEGSRPPFWRVPVAYCAAVCAGGGLPAAYLGSCPEEAAKRFDGLLLTGGGDIDPALFGESPIDAKLDADPARDIAEFDLLAAFARTGKPILGICRGAQVINVYFSGTLWQDLPSQRGISHTGTRHACRVCAPWLHELIGAEVLCNSEHHQAIKTLAPPLSAAAYAPDGIIEAFAHEDLPVYGVQWHPERMLGGIDKLGDMTPVFRFFAELCGQVKK